MPYYLHLTIADPMTGREYITAKDAHAAKVAMETATDWTVTFTATTDERLLWRKRERTRFDDATYARVPWSCADWYYAKQITGEPLPVTCPSDDDGSYDTLHFAHLSITHPGMVAYTPSEDFGIADRQIRVRPGKYLQKFAPSLSRADVDRFCAECKCFDDSNVLQYARTADDIERIYVNGPESCMSHRADWYTKTGGMHPVRAYGDSDLSVAYMVSVADDRIIARAVIWEANNVYSRIYGDAHRLKALLQDAGFNPGNVLGATIHAIPTARSDRYLMPYLDGVDSASLRGTGTTAVFVLDDDGPYAGDSTDGTASRTQYNECSNCCERIPDDQDLCASCAENEEDETYTCEHCARETCSINQIRGYGSVCDDCYDEHYRCATCDAHHFDNGNEVARHPGLYCDDCLSDMTAECAIEGCNETWVEGSLPDTEQATRTRLHLSTLCPSCAVRFVYCAECDDYTPADQEDCDQCGVPPRVRCSHTMDLLADVPVMEVAF